MTLNQEKINTFIMGLMCVELITMQPIEYVDKQLNLQVVLERLDQSFTRLKYQKFLQVLIE